MNLRKIGLFFVAVCCQVSLSHAAFILNVGNFNLLPNTANQKIQLNITSTAPGTDPLVTGFKLKAQTGDGASAGAEPLFTNVLYNGSGSIWNAFPTTLIGSTFNENGIDGPGQFTDISVIFSPANNVAANGLLVELVFSTVGLSSGTYPLLLANSQQGEDSSLVLTGGAGVPIQITNGNLTIQAIPEPSFYAGFALASCAVFGIWKNRKQLQAAAC
jgi:hypothetical protein